jgi:hypothetical protein
MPQHASVADASFGLPEKFVRILLERPLNEETHDPSQERIFDDSPHIFKSSFLPADNFFAFS